jgi:non-specific serine/threonine protein kinase
LAARGHIFVGRLQELAEFTRLLQTGRLLTLTGIGGAGKTRLAVQLAREILRDYRDGVWFVDLSPVTAPESVTKTLAAVGMPEPPDYAASLRMLTSLGRRHVLVVLDNCEHVLDACSQVVAGLLRGGPHLRIVATSREPLGVVGETVRSVPPLAVPDPDDVLSWEQLVEYPSVRLLVERATNHSSFVLDSRDASAIAAICWRTDGLPLALELAAARLPVLGAA